MELPQIIRTPPTGLSFEVSDLVLLQAWAELHELRIVIELDHCVDGDEYEEVVAFYATDSIRLWSLWRSLSEVVVQPLIGRARRYSSVADALDSLTTDAPRQ
jgi:hypothetical protein